MIAGAKIRKLTAVSLHELWVRGGQALSAFAERRGWSRQFELPQDQYFSERLTCSLEQYLELFRERAEPAFFQSFAEQDTTIKAWKFRWPEEARRTVERADRIADGSFDLLGMRNLRFGDPIDWHLAPISGVRAPLVHWSHLSALDSGFASEKKVLWELNRHQFFATLGQAYWLTEDERYALTFVRLLNSWMDQNPPKLGLNWSSSLEIAFRSISWIWALHFFKESPALTKPVFIRLLKFLYLSAQHIETYLSTYFSPNTHLTGEALGLFYIGSLFPEFKEAEAWRKKGLTILIDCLPIQVKPDGVYFEQSSYYHRYTTDFYIHLLILLRQNREPTPPILEEKLNALLDHLMYITRPDGSSPLFGDDDGGRLVMLHSREANDFRATLSTGAALLGRQDLKFVAREPAEETLWLLGAPGLASLDELHASEPANKSVAFTHGGYYVMRESWESTANYVLFDCGPHGALNAGHAHADSLSIELAAHGRTLLIDPGTYAYTGPREVRDWFRSTLAHNTLTIDKESSSVPDGPFSWKSIANSECLKWISSDRFDYVEGRHDGYERLANPVKHTRSIMFLKRDYWIVCDHVETGSEHSAELWFHFDSGATPSLVVRPDSLTAVQDGNSALEIFSFGGNGCWKEEDGWVSHCFGERKPARIFAWSAKVRGRTELFSFLVPPVHKQLFVRQINAVGGHAFEITYEEGLDLVMISDLESDGIVQAGTLASNFQWTWARFSQAQRSYPREVVLLGGTWMAVEGKRIVESEKRAEYLAATALDERYRVETSEGTSVEQLPISAQVCSTYKPQLNVKPEN